MTVVRDRAEARWLPSRFDFAFFRLIAFLRLKASKPEPRDGIVLAIERHQNAAENYLGSICVFVVLTAFVASLIDVALPFGTAVALAIPITAVYLNVQIVFTGLTIAPVLRKLTPLRNAIAVNSAVLMIIVIAAATLLAVSSSPLRHVGSGYLVLVAANAIASLIVFVLQRQIADAERAYGVEW